jgi:hypothetical protein
MINGVVINQKIGSQKEKKTWLVSGNTRVPVIRDYGTSVSDVKKYIYVYR